MHKLIIPSITLLALAVCCLFPAISAYHVLLFTNRCPFPIWLAVSGNAGNENINLQNMKIDPQHGTGLPFPNGWTGKVWSKTSCNQTGEGCVTGDCGANNDCHKNGPTTPATVVYIALDSLHQQDYYQLSLANGFNVPVEVEPLNHPSTNGSANGNGSYNATGGHHCTSAGCKGDLNQHCPPELAVKSDLGVVVGCRSPCQALATEEYCCTGAHRAEAKCANSASWPTDYSKLFHESCPDAKTYPGDSVAQPKYCQANGVRLNVNFCLKKH